MPPGSDHDPPTVLLPLVPFNATFATTPPSGINNMVRDSAKFDHMY